MENAIQIRNYNLHLGLNDKSVHILKDIHFDIPKGKITGIIGASGSGKSMLLKSFLHLFEGNANVSTNGQILVSMGQNSALDVLEIEASSLLSLRKNHFGLVFQLSAEVLNPSQRIQNQLVEKLLLVKTPKADLNKLCLSVLKQVGIEDPQLTLQKYPHQLSGGQLQRILIAIGIIHKPQVLLIDEPTSALDEKLKIEILELISNLKRSLKMTVVLVSHNMKLITQYCDELVVIDKGVIVENGDCQNIISNPQNVITKELLGIKSPKKDMTLSQDRGDVLVELRNIHHSFSSSKGWFSKQEQNVLSNFNLKICEGDIIGLVGESGFGKSTIGRIIAGLLIPDKGNVFYKNKSIEYLPKNEYKDYRSSVQIIFQDPFGSLSPHRTGKQVLKEALDILNVDFDDAIIAQKLAEVSLDTSILGKTPKQMSGGQRQRLLIARALLGKPKLLVCDEIFSSLDTIVKKQILATLKDLSERYNMAILFISHDLETIKDVSKKIVSLRPSTQNVL